MDHSVGGGWIKKVICTPVDIDTMLESMAKAIVTNSPALNELVFLGVFSNGVPLAERLAALILKTEHKTIPVGALDVSVYRDDIESLGQFISLKESRVPVDIHNKDIILIDDVIHHGRTARAAMNAVFDFGRPRQVAYCALLDRGERALPISVNYVGQVVSIPSNHYVSVSLLEIDGDDSVSVVSAVDS